MDLTARGGSGEGAPPGPRDGRAKLLVILYALAALVAAGLGAGPLLGLPCEKCTGGLLPMIVPWVGATGYGWLAFLAFRSHRSPWLSPTLGLYVFVHACLTVESFGLHRMCAGCLAAAALAVLAALVQSWLNPGDRLTLVCSLVLGSLAGFLHPFDRVDYWVTRKAWPAKILNAAPRSWTRTG